MRYARLSGIALVALALTVAAGCSSLHFVTYSPIAGVAGGPSGPESGFIKAGPHCCPSTALLVTATKPVGENDFQWVSIAVPVPVVTPPSKITQVEVCYKIETSSPGSTYISQTRLTEMTTPDKAMVRVDDATDQKALGPVCYSTAASLTPTGSIALELKVVFGSVSDRIIIGGVKLGFA